MSKGRSALHARREALLQRSAAQREDLVRRLARFQKPLAWADRGLAVARAVRRHGSALGIGMGIGFVGMLFPGSREKMVRLAQSAGTLFSGLIGAAQVLRRVRRGRRPDEPAPPAQSAS